MREVTVSHCDSTSFAVTATIFNRHLRFLVDTGADVSALPANFKSYAFPLDVKLTAANNTPIRSYGCVATTLSFSNLHRAFKAKFVVADVTTPILGADFFKENRLLIDVNNRKLLDAETKLSINLCHCNTLKTQKNALSTIDPALLDILQSNAAVFDVHAPRPVPSITFTIDNSEVPKAARPYRLSPDKVLAAKHEIQKEIELGRMKRSSSQYASPFFPVRKPDGSWRFVADYTKLNNVTRKDNYSPPRIDDLLSRIPRHCVFTKIDLQKAFFLIPVHEPDQHKTAITTPFGLYEYTVMPMGMKNSAQTLQRYVDTVLSDSPNTIAYCDDILLFTSESEHLPALDNLLQKLHNAGLVVNRQKSQFLMTETVFLGHRLTPSGCSPSEVKLQGLKDYAVPKTLKQVRRFLGMINFYRKFIPHAAQIQQPLTALTHKNVTFLWTEHCQNAFDTLIRLACSAVELAYPSTDDQYTLTTDASGTAVGATLSSQHGPLGFFSRQLTGAELNYSAYDKELLAVFKSVQHFEWLLFGRDFTLCTDHKPLLHMFSKTATVERRRRHIEYLSTFDFHIKHVAGRDNVVADALSRDKALDSIEFSTPFSCVPPTLIRQQQEQDATLRSIPSHTKSISSGVWRDHDGCLLVPSVYRQQLINSVHSLSHTGILSTLRQLQLMYTWPQMRKDISAHINACIACQSSKVTRHTRPPFKSYGAHPKFSAVHIDFVGPLPSVNNKRYLVTLFDRGSRWFDAYPCAHATAESAVNALLKWVSHFGVPELLISDRGTHFEASLFQEAAKRLGIEKRRVTAYHPAANGAVERQHRRLKDALKSRSELASKTWLNNLPLVLLGLNNSISHDSGFSAAQIVYGRQLTIPGCIFDGHYDLADYSLPERSFNRNASFVPAGLRDCKYVWLQRATLTSKLQRPYVGPYKIINRNFENHTAKILINGKTETITMERLKPALIEIDCIHIDNTSTHPCFSSPPKKTVTFA